MHTRSFTPPATGTPWLARALAVSAVMHLAVVIVLAVVTRPEPASEVTVVDIEIAPAPPKAEALAPEIAKPVVDPAGGSEEPTPASAAQPTNQEPSVMVDAGIDAAVDASAPDA